MHVIGVQRAKCICMFVSWCSESADSASSDGHCQWRHCR